MIALDEVSPTKETVRKTKQFLDYVASHLDAILTFSASSMVLVVHSDASYLIDPTVRSQAGSYFFMSNDSQDLKNNGAVLNIAMERH